MLNVVFLMVVAFLPFPTALVAEYVRTPNAVRMATVTYGLTMIALALMFNAVWIYASSGRRLLIDGIDDESIRKGTRSYRMGPVVYAVVTLLAFVNPFISLGLFAALAVYWLLPSSGPG
jgi:uncharacterized membrane protein